MFRASELRNKEVINLTCNEKLGCICDFEICTTSGEISALLLKNKSGGFHGGKNKLVRIPWENITGIGDEIILVNITEAE